VIVDASFLQLSIRALGRAIEDRQAIRFEIRFERMGRISLVVVRFGGRQDRHRPRAFDPYTTVFDRQSSSLGQDPQRTGVVGPEMLISVSGTSFDRDRPIPQVVDLGCLSFEP